MAQKPSYTLQFPFSLQSGHRIADLSGGPIPIPLSGLSASLTQAAPGYAITVEGFPSASSANSYTAQVWLGLTTLMLDTKAAFSASTQVEQGTPVVVSNPSLPPSMQGPRVIVDEGQPHVTPSGTRLIAFATGTATASMTTPPEKAIASLSRGMTHTEAEALFGNARFRTAVDLFAAANFEASGAARLLTYSMALEVLTPSIQKHSVALALLEKWDFELTAEISRFAPDSDEVSALESLEREIIFRKDASIRSRIRQFVRETLSRIGATDSENVAKSAVKAYDRRSALLHDGFLPEQEIANTIGDLRVILERTFEAHLATTSGQ